MINFFKTLWGVATGLGDVFDHVFSAIKAVIALIAKMPKALMPDSWNDGIQSLNNSLQVMDTI